MKAKIVKQSGTKLIVELEMDLEGSMQEMEEHIQKVLNEGGKLASKAALEKFDTDGSPIQVKGATYTSKGREKKR